MLNSSLLAISDGGLASAWVQSILLNRLTQADMNAPSRGAFVVEYRGWYSVGDISMSVNAAIAFVVLLGGGFVTALGLYFGLRAVKLI